MVGFPRTLSGGIFTDRLERLNRVSVVNGEINMLYNVTFKLDDESTRLIPRIPVTAGGTEDKETKRVCFADSVEHCIGAMSESHSNLYTGCLIIVRSVDEYMLDRSKIMTPEELFYSGRVPDALENNEYWYLDEVDVYRDMYEITHYYEDYVCAFTCIEKEVIEKIARQYIPHFRIRRYEDSEQAYDRVIETLYGKGQYTDCADFEIEIVSRPWGHKRQISRLEMARVAEVCV